MDNVYSILTSAAGLAMLFLMVSIALAVALRRVVPTNMAHIVQRSKTTTVYGRGQASGNTYYAIPSWVPRYGIRILEMPESIFQVELTSYEAYDCARLPFVVDVTAFFRVDKPELAAQRVSSFDELIEQLERILKGAVRRVLASNSLEHTMAARVELGKQFSTEVDSQIEQWGVVTVKTIEFMDLRDAKGSDVIHAMMAKEQSRIDRESRVSIAGNKREAELAEIEARQAVDVRAQEADQQVGVRKAEKEKAIGTAMELSKQEIQRERTTTAQTEMETQKVREEKAAEIKKSVRLTEAAANSESRRIASEGELQAVKNEALGIEAKGKSEAEAKRLELMAPVSSQIELAKEIGSNNGYQEYLLSLERVRASERVGVSMSAALEKAEIKIISSGAAESGSIQGNVSSVMDMFTAKGGTGIAAMLAAASQTPEGRALVSKLTGSKDEGDQS